MSPEAGGSLEVGDRRMQRTVLMVRRTEVAQSSVRFAYKPLQRGGSDTRLADAWFGREQDDLTLAALCSLPASVQQLDLFLATDQRRQSGRMERLEPSFNGAGTDHPPCLYGLGDPFQLDHAKIGALEQRSDGSPRVLCYDDRVWLCQRL